MTTLQDKVVKIKVEHYCYLCVRDFPPGTEMRYWAGVVDGDFNSCYSCNTCDCLMPLLTNDFIWTEGYVADECNGEISPEELLHKLTAKEATE